MALAVLTLCRSAGRLGRAPARPRGQAAAESPWAWGRSGAEGERESLMQPYSPGDRRHDGRGAGWIHNDAVCTGGTEQCRRVTRSQPVVALCGTGAFQETRREAGVSFCPLSVHMSVPVHLPHWVPPPL